MSWRVAGRLLGIPRDVRGRLRVKLSVLLLAVAATSCGETREPAPAPVAPGPAPSKAVPSQDLPPTGGIGDLTSDRPFQLELSAEGRPDEAWTLRVRGRAREMAPWSILEVSADPPARAPTQRRTLDLAVGAELDEGFPMPAMQAACEVRARISSSHGRSIEETATLAIHRDASGRLTAGR